MYWDDRKAFATAGVKPAAPTMVSAQAVIARARLSVHMADALAHIFSLDLSATGGVLAPVGEPSPTHEPPPPPVLDCAAAHFARRGRRPSRLGRGRRQRR